MLDRADLASCLVDDDIDVTGFSHRLEAIKLASGKPIPEMGFE
jgi:hypothetical protein